MPGTLPIYALALSGKELPGAVVSHFRDVETFSSFDELLASGTREPGWLLLTGEVSEEVLQHLVRLAGEDGNWSPLLLREDEGGRITLLPLLLGYPEEVERALVRMRGDVPGPALLSFRILLRELSRIRHDINNPLTAAFAEVQLLIMDAEAGSEAAESLKVIESQLHRIRDLAAQLTAFRAPVH